jgi:hypothetical protein
VASCDHERGTCALALENSIGGCCGAVVDELEPSRPVKLGFEDLTSFCDTVLNADALIWGCSWDFGADGLAVGSENVYVGEGTTDINSELVSLSHGESLPIIEEDKNVRARRKRWRDGGEMRGNINKNKNHDKLEVLSIQTLVE